MLKCEMELLIVRQWEAESGLCHTMLALHNCNGDHDSPRRFKSLPEIRRHLANTPEDIFKDVSGDADQTTKKRKKPSGSLTDKGSKDVEEKKKEILTKTQILLTFPLTTSLGLIPTVTSASKKGSAYKGGRTR